MRTSIMSTRTSGVPGCVCECTAAVTAPPLLLINGLGASLGCGARCSPPSPARRHRF
jgi:hypothetical protein